MFVTRGSKNSLFFCLIFFPTWIVVNDINFGSAKVFQWVPWRHKVLTHGQERLFRKVTSVSIHSFVEWLDTFSYVLRPADVTVKEVNHIRCFAIDIAKYLILLSCRLAMEHLCVLDVYLSFLFVCTVSLTLVSDPTSRRFIGWLLFQTFIIYIYIYFYIRLKIKPNSVRIRF